MIHYTQYIYILFFLLCGPFVNSFAQGPRAWSMQHQLPALSSYFDLPVPADKIRQLEKDGQGSELKTYCFAVNVAVNLTPEMSGQWDTIPEKGLVWRLGIHGQNASLLDLLIEQFDFYPGMTLYVYNSEQTIILGPFNAATAKGVLPVESIRGDNIIVEWNIPANITNYSCFNITSIGYGFRDLPEPESMLKADPAANCNIDVNCTAGNHWQREKRSVVKMQIKKSDGTYFCSGALINQADGNKRKYLITAHHCIETGADAERTTFIFGYEKVACKGKIFSNPESVVGSKLLATKKELDFTLVELSGDITYIHKPFFAGWNNSETAPQSGIGIHHPEGDAKKISIDNNLLVSATFTDSQLNCDDNAHWQVLKWDKGITQKGSSGSPLFGPDHLIAGTLTGGAAQCNDPVNDFYSKLSMQWGKYPEAATSLKSWLDPNNTGRSTLGGYDPYAGFEGKCDTLTHIGNNEEQLLVQSDKWGYLTGHNDQKWTSFAEKFKNDTIVKIVGLEFDIAKVYRNGSRVKFMIWSGDEFPVKPEYEKEMLISPEYRNYPMQVYFDQVKELKGNFFAGFSINYENVLDTFAIYQSGQRAYPGISAMYVEDGVSWRSLSEEQQPVYASLGIKVIGKFGKGDKSNLVLTDDLKIISQPGSNLVHVYFENPSQNVVVECFDPVGRQMPVNEFNRSTVIVGDMTYLQIEINSSNLSYGMYILRVRDNKKSQTGKFIRL